MAIRDHGIGIPAEARPHVFERGFRAHTVGAIPGTGLGLFISAEIVK
jgi:signal transduction histidine kinase